MYLCQLSILFRSFSTFLSLPPTFFIPDFYDPVCGFFCRFVWIDADCRMTFCGTTTILLFWLVLGPLLLLDGCCRLSVVNHLERGGFMHSEMRLHQQRPLPGQLWRRTVFGGWLWYPLNFINNICNNRRDHKFIPPPFRNTNSSSCCCSRHSLLLTGGSSSRSPPSRVIHLQRRTSLGPC